MKFQRMKDVCLGATVAVLVMGAAPAAYAKVETTPSENVKPSP